MKQPAKQTLNHENIHRIEDIHHLIAAPGRKSSRSRLCRWSRDVDDAEITQLAQELLDEKDIDRTLKYLYLFRRRRFPLNHSRLLELARSEDEDIARAARAALSLITHPTVRSLALELIEDAKEPWDGVTLLVQNYQEGDCKLIERLVGEDYTSKDYYHYFCFDMRQFFETNLSSEALPALTILYEKEPCAMCRNSFVKLLHQLGPLPSWMVEECRYDSYQRIREIVMS